MTLLLGAGMTIRKAWNKIVKDYIRERDADSHKERIAYEEMYETECYIESGMSELEAYEEFGRRCDCREYMKFASLLAQNLKKGSKDLTRLLENESEDAFEQRKNLARKKGEEASTKLLIPMIMMLCCVMAIVMVPALMSFKF